MHITYPQPCVCPTCHRCPTCGHYTPQTYVPYYPQPYIDWPYTYGISTTGGYVPTTTTGTTSNPNGTSVTTLPNANITLTAEDTAKREWSVSTVEDKK